MYHVIWVVAFLAPGRKHRHPHSSAAVPRKVYSGPSVGVVLGQRRRRLTGIEPAMGCDAGPTLNRNRVGSRYIVEARIGFTRWDRRKNYYYCYFLRCHYAVTPLSGST